MQAYKAAVIFPKDKEERHWHSSDTSLVAGAAEAPRQHPVHPPEPGWPRSSPGHPPAPHGIGTASEGCSGMQATAPELLPGNKARAAVLGAKGPGRPGQGCGHGSSDGTVAVTATATVTMDSGMSGRRK